MRFHLHVDNTLIAFVKGAPFPFVVDTKVACASKSDAVSSAIAGIAQNVTYLSTLVN